MSIRKNDIPILEYDDDPLALIQPDHEALGLKLPKRAVFAFLGESVDRYAEAHCATVISHFESATKNYPIYKLSEDGKEFCLVQAPVGSSAATQILDWLFAYGVEKVISAGSCGVLTEHDENTFLIPRRALRDEGTSYHYLPPSRFVNLSDEALAAIEKTMRAHGLPYLEVTTWSTDGFFRETKEKVNYRKQEGCSAVEMECAGLAACAKMRGATFGQILFAADTLADVEHYDSRSWGKASFEIALRLCIEAVLRL